MQGWALGELEDIAGSFYYALLEPGGRPGWAPIVSDIGT